MAGRIKAVVVEGSHDGAGAVITNLVALAHEAPHAERVRFSGPGTFDAAVQSHIREVILPLADRILTALQQPQQSYELSVANLGAAAAVNLGTRVSGFSADVPVLLAILSASLGIPIDEDLVATGHVASMDGDIAMVGGLPAKLSAALADESIRCFVHPALDGDSSLRVLAPQQLERAEAALRAARERLETRSVRNVGDLVTAVFKDADTVVASLRRGFFALAIPPEAALHPAGQATRFFIADNPRRFWSALERHLLAGQGSAARETLRAFVQYHVDRRQYPAGCGGHLLGLLRSLPPATRRLKRVLPVLSMEDCIGLSQHATQADHEDVGLLFGAAGNKLTIRGGPPPPETDAESSGQPDAAGAALDALLSEISVETLAEKIDGPIDEARATYRIESVTTDSYDEFLEAVVAFYLHLARNSGRVAADVESDAVAAEAQECLEEAFVRDGGSTAAWAEVRQPLRGGMALIFNAMTDQFKTEARRKHVRWVFKSVLDPRDWEARRLLADRSRVW